jgi:hypothetical protein
MSCEHMDFHVQANVARLTSEEGGPVTGYCVEIKMHCSECGKPFQFLGLEPGMDTQGARVSLDGLEANIAITPEGLRPNPLQRLAYNVGRFDG